LFTGSEAPVRLLVFGATGGTGREVVLQALERGHEVTAFVRDPAALDAALGRVRVLQGDATDAKAVAAAVPGHDAVVCSLGVRNTFKGGGLMVRSLQCILPAMEAAGVRRFVLVSAFGVGATRKDAPLVPRLMYRLLLKDIFADKKASEDYLRTRDVDWTIAYPVLLTDEPRSGIYCAGERLELRGVPKIARADVAHFVVSELEAPAYLRKVAILSRQGATRPPSSGRSS
jgi:putative NADH-flavin reductase